MDFVGNMHVVMIDKQESGAKIEDVIGAYLWCFCEFAKSIFKDIIRRQETSSCKFLFMRTKRMDWFSMLLVLVS